MAVSTCDTCGGALDPAATLDAAGVVRYSWHPGCRPPVSCRCRTPWDQPDQLDIVTGQGKSRQVVTHPVDHSAGPDLRAAAEYTLGLLGRTLMGPWEVRRSGKRTAWVVELDRGAIAAAYTPVATSHGQHCTDCHQDFAGSNLWDMHRHGIRPRCVAPPLIRNVATGQPMMIRDQTGIWQFNPNNIWPDSTPPLTPMQIEAMREADRMRRMAMR